VAVWREHGAVIRAILMLAFWALIIPFGALIFFPWTLITGKADALYWFAMWVARTGIRLAGVRVRVVGREKLDPNRAYIFMSNHVSNLDPPVLMPVLPQRVSVMVKKELFRVPLLGRAMRMASLVPIDRHNKESAIASVRAAAVVLRSGLGMVVFPEGTRSPDGRLLPFKKGPFYMAMDTGAPIVPVTVLGTREMMSKGKLAVRPGMATVVFHEPVETAGVEDRDKLIAKVRMAVETPAT
jgi:1-acyl-sn-glycerol-3-phosphate acyltransferase